MKMMFLGITIATLMFSSQNLIAQIDLNDPEIASTIRTKYEKSSDLPDGLAFHWIIHAVSFLNSEDDNSAVAWIQGEMGLPESDAQQVVAYMLAALEAFNSDRDDFTRNLACRADKPRAAGDEIYPIFEEMDDAKLALAAKHLELMKAEIGIENAGRLQQMLDLSKLEITHVDFRHKDHYKQTGANPNEVLFEICNRLNKTN